MEKQPNVLLVVDEDYAYGIRHGFYQEELGPKFGEDNRCEVLTEEEFKKRGFMAPMSPCGENIFYLRNPYVQNTYELITKHNLDIELANNRAYAIREALVMLGALDINFVEEVSDQDKKHQNVNGGVEVCGSDLKAEVNHSKEISMNVKCTIESHAPTRVPHSAVEVNRYLLTHGLENENNLKHLVERLERDGKLNGKEIVELTFLSELDSALDIIGSFNYKQIVKADIAYKIEHHHTHVQNMKIEADFG